LTAQDRKTLHILVSFPMIIQKNKFFSLKVLPLPARAVMPYWRWNAQRVEREHKALKTLYV